jgi:hypothetical protein
MCREGWSLACTGEVIAKFWVGIAVAPPSSNRIEAPMVEDVDLLESDDKNMKS